MIGVVLSRVALFVDLCVCVVVGSFAFCLFASGAGFLRFVVLAMPLLCFPFEKKVVNDKSFVPIPFPQSF